MGEAMFCDLHRAGVGDKVDIVMAASKVENEVADPEILSYLQYSEVFNYVLIWAFTN